MLYYTQMDNHNYKLRASSTGAKCFWGRNHYIYTRSGVDRCAVCGLTATQIMEHEPKDPDDKEIKDLLFDLYKDEINGKRGHRNLGDKIVCVFVYELKDVD